MKQILQNLQRIGKCSISNLQAINAPSYISLTPELLQSTLHVLAYADVVDYQTVFLPRIFAVDARNRLYKRMPLQRLVVVEHCEAWNVEARDPHIDNDRNAEVRKRLLKFAVKHLPMRLVAQEIKHLLGVVDPARGYHVHHRETLIAFKFRLKLGRIED